MNEPYSPADRVFYTLSRHAEARGLAPAMIEIRNDLVRSPRDAAGMGRAARHGCSRTLTPCRAAARTSRCRRPIRAFVRIVDRVNRVVGRFAMYLFYVLGAVLLYSTIWRVIFGVPVNWALEMSQFILSAYYLLGGAYTMQLGAHVRMDLFYNRFPPGGARRSTRSPSSSSSSISPFSFAGGISATELRHRLQADRTTRPGRRCSGRSRSS